MTLPLPTDPNPSDKGVVVTGFVFLAISTVFPLYLFAMAMWPPGGNDFGGHGMMMFLVGIASISISPLTAASGLYLIHKYSGRTSVRLLGLLASLPTIVALLVIARGVALEMRPIPQYDPQNYQHIVGRKLRDVRSELDTRRSSGGSTSDKDGPYNYLSLRGMEIRFNNNGVVTEVKQGRME